MPPSLRAPEDAVAWPEADELFGRNPLWHGADAAYSVRLDDDRTLWLFGDTFVGASRRRGRMVHNTVALQHGRDPSRATAEAVWRGDDTDPRPFVDAGVDGEWLWPMAGANTPAGVVVFLMRVRSARPDLPSVLDAWQAEGSLEFFEVTGWTAALVDITGDDPVAWPVRLLPTPPVTDRVIPGPGAWCDDDHLYAYGWRDGHELRRGRWSRRVRYRGYRTPRRAFLARWAVSDIGGAGLVAPRWWGPEGWTADASAAMPVVESPATEFSVHREADGSFTLVETAPWLAVVDRFRVLSGLRSLKRFPRSARMLTRARLMRASVCLRTAPALHGPWTPPRRLFTPRVARDVAVYAGKAHPQLDGPGLVCTYATIALTARRTLDDASIYRPRFVVVRGEDRVRRRAAG